MFSLPGYIADYLKNQLGLTDEQKEVALYTLQVILYGFYAFLGTGLVGLFLGCLFPTLIIAITIFILRCFSGGAHSNSPFGCILLSALLIPLSGKLIVTIAPLMSVYVLVILIVFGFLVSFYVTWRLAPVDTPAKPVSSESHRLQLKIMSLFAVVLIFILQGVFLSFVRSPWTETAVLALEGGLFWQAFSLTKAGHRFFAVADNFKMGG
ncbi:MAG: accessory gene regulator B family protein [Bacillota bacterium]